MSISRSSSRQGHATRHSVAVIPNSTSAATSISGDSPKRENTFDLGDRQKQISMQTLNVNATRHKRHITFRMLAENFHLIGNLPFPAKVMDLACGNAEFSRKFLTEFANIGEIVGVDSSKDVAALNNGDQENCGAGSPRVAFRTVQGDFEVFYNLPKAIGENSFDLVVSFGTFQTFKDQSRALKNVVRCLKPGGYLMMHIPCKRQQDCPEFHDILLVHPKWKKYIKRKTEIDLKLPPEHKYMQSDTPEKDYRALLENVGFAVKKCSKLTTFFSSSNEEIDSYLAKYAMKFTKGVPDEVKDEFLKDCATIFTKNLNKTTGRIGFERADDRLFIVAQKS